MSRAMLENRVSTKEMSVAEAAYVAAFLDGEGTITLLLHGHDSTCRRRGKTVVPQVTAANTNLRLLEALVEKTGNGRISGSSETRVDRKPLYRWELSPNQIRQVLPQVEPYLEGKRRQAQIVMEFQSLRPVREDGTIGRGWADGDLPRVEALYNEVRALNARGKQVAGQFFLPVGDGKERDRICTVEGCDLKRYYGNEWCYEHWLQRSPKSALKCGYCGEEFETAHPDRTRYCSPKCQFRSWEERVGRKSAGREIGKYRKLTDEERAEIRGLWAAGERNKPELARAYGVDRTTIGNAVADLPQDIRKKCECCGLEFEAVRHTARFCSESCTRKSRRASARKE